MKHRLLRILALMLILALLLPLSPMPARAEEGDDDGNRTTYDEGTSYSVDYEPEDEPQDPAVNWSVMTGELPVSTDTDSLLEESDLVYAPEEAPARSEAQMGSGGSGVLGAPSVDMPRQLTIEDIQAMNPGSQVIDCYTNEGYLSTLVGKFYEGKVKDMEDGVKSIQGLAALLGLSKGSNFFCVYRETNNTGYTFYTYQQRYGGVTLRYATLRIVVDPEGYTAGLSCSFVPNVGTASQEPKITAEQAVEIVKKRFAKFNLTYYPEQTVLMAVPYNNIVVNCYLVYTNNPDAYPGFDIPYYEHLVAIDGSYLTIMPTTSFATPGGDAVDNSYYFEGMRVQTLNKTVQLNDGTTRELSVPVCFNPRDNKYYLMDPSRKIAVAQYYDFNFDYYTVKFVTGSTPDGWSDNNLLAYANYIILYDFYLDHGIRSVDGFGTPILVTVGYCEEDGTPIDNCCYYGINHGWACFAVSDANHSSDCVDVCGHEYTHGITRHSMQGIYYQNETGAINEAYSDIMGNLAEMSLNYTSDRTWLHEERSGQHIRNLGDPNERQQPAYVGDVYYRPPVLNPNFDLNDYGGVHYNNSLVGHIAYLMDQAGMSYEQQIAMWLTSIEIINPLSNYEDLHGALLFSLKINGMLQEYGPALNKAFKEAGLNENLNESYLAATKKGYGRITFETDGKIAAAIAQAFFFDENKNMTIHTPDPNGTVSLLLPAGKYKVQLATLINDKVTYYYYTANGWSTKGGTLATVTVADGGSVKLLGTSEKPKAQSTKLELVDYNAGYFSMKMPKGWKFEVIGEYAAWGIKLYDPNNKSTQLFWYNYMAPLHRSATARSVWAQVNEVIGNGPVLSSNDVIGVVNSWNYCGQYQAYYEGRKYFDDLYNIDILGGIYYNGYYTKNFNDAVESACLVHCDSEFGDECFLSMTTALVNLDITHSAGSYYFYTAFDLGGIMAPVDRYPEVFEDLLTCLKSIRFTDNYIKASQATPYPMASTAIRTEHLDFLTQVHIAVLKKVVG